MRDAFSDPVRLRAVSATGLLEAGAIAPLDVWVLRARELTGAAAAYLSLVDGKNTHFPVAAAASATQGSGTVATGSAWCGTVVAGDAEFVVEDLEHDERTRGHEALANGVRAYAGIPMRNVDGRVLGSFCAVDLEPRPWSTEQLRALRELATAAESELRLRIALNGAEDLRALIDTHHRAHELMISGASLPQVLETIVAGVQAQADGMIGSILLLDEEGRLHHAAAPDLPAGYCAAIDGLSIGPSVGSCGTAAYHAIDVFVSDVRTDPRWEGFGPLAAAHDLVACWSAPIIDAAGIVLGTFALYDHRARTPAPLEIDLLHQASRLAAVAIERDRAGRDLLVLATQDPLTGLPNRARLLEHLQGRLDAARPSGADVTVLFCDLDRFKIINDSLGHEVGDAVLREVARRLGSALRGEDLLARLGGDEFVVVPAGHHGIQEARGLAARLGATLSAPVRDDDGGRHSVDVSIGIAVVQRVDAPEAIRRADTAMYSAKRGAEPIVAYEARANEARRAELRVAEALRGAAGRGEMRLVYQPVVDAATGVATGVEALLRWEHPELGFVPPDRFIPVAEDHGLMPAIGRWVLEEALGAAVCLQSALGADFRMGVNLSPRQLADPALPGMVERALGQAGIAAVGLVLEITETALLSDDPETATVLHALDALGCRIVLDDFGTGYSSLSHLRRLPIRGVKVDRSFVDGLGDGGDDEAIVAGVIGLAKGLRLAVTGEGVETEVQASLLRAMGCDFAQGYLFARPVPLDAVLRALVPSAIVA